MSIEHWSESILLVELPEDPGFTDDVNNLLEQAEGDDDISIVLNFASVNFVNSSNIAKLLKLRKKLLLAKRRLILCNINTNVWGLFLVTGLDKVFEFADNLAMALASVQIGQDHSAKG